MASTELSRNGVFSTARKIREIGNAAREVFVDMEDPIHAFECAMCCGEHIAMLGKPGTGKSALGRFFGNSMDLTFNSTVLNVDTVEEKLLGPISFKQLQEDIWDRKWSGLAVSDFYLADEIGKAPNAVLNMLLKAMEEREAETPDYYISLPLHCMMAGSNETLSTDAAAVWDRFTIRLEMKYVSKAEDFVKLIHTNVSNPPTVPVTREELENLRNKSEEMSTNTNGEIDEFLLGLWDEIGVHITHRVSNRRWQRLLKVAAGRAILFERDEIHREDLIVGKWILWDEPEDAEKIHRWLEEKIHIEKTRFKEFVLLMNELEDLYTAVDSMDREDKINLVWRCEEVINEAKNAKDMKNEWSLLLQRALDIKNGVLG